LHCLLRFDLNVTIYQLYELPSPRTQFSVTSPRLDQGLILILSFQNSVLKSTVQFYCVAGSEKTHKTPFCLETFLAENVCHSEVPDDIHMARALQMNTLWWTEYISHMRCATAVWGLFTACLRARLTFQR
jgi:hypothetical protein